MAAALCALPLGAMAEINIDFESPEGYKSLGVYDVWEESPFRTGELTGNWAVTPNPDREVSEITGEVSNGSELVLGAQRSRFGSNRFGVRIDLPELLPITPESQFVHVMIHKPKEGRVMLVGLGSRVERLDQNPYAEQFWVVSTNTVIPGEWCDAVFPVRGANGVNIRSLVVVPDCESPHDLTDDFLFYVDNIIVSDSSVPRIANEFYPIVGDKATAVMNRSDRYSSQINAKVGKTTQRLSVKQNSNHKLYQDLTDQAFFAKAGDVVTPSVTYTGTWMHAYCYVDWNGDGQFASEVNEDGIPAEGSELVAYNHYQGKNSKGATAAQNLGSNTGMMPSFTVPEGTAPGMYRIRYKIDWDNIDPMGGMSTSSNGGIIADAMLCIYGDKVVLNDFQLNGEILAADGTKLNAYEVPADEAFTIRSAPEKGFYNGGVDVKCGYNLNGEQRDKYGNSQYIIYDISAKSFAEDGTYTIPAKQMRANILFNGRMVEEGSAVDPSEEEAYLLNFPQDLKIERTDRRLNSFSLDTGDDAVELSLEANTDNNVYVKMIDIEVPVMAGQTITPSVDYTGNAMHTYWYVDLNEDGAFSNTLNEDGTPAGELLSYSHYQGKNSLGNDQAPGIKPGTNNPFVIPAGTPAGLYRARFKIDWNNIDPAGQYGLGSNDIDANGGYVVDFMIHVYDAQSAVTANVTEATGNLTAGEAVIGATPYAAPRATQLTVSAKSTKDIAIDKLVARSGYHLDQARPSHFGNIYWTETELTADNGNYTVPAELLDRPVHLIATFNGLDGIFEITLDGNAADSYNLQGIRVANPSNGLYIINGQKTIVK